MNKQEIKKLEQKISTIIKTFVQPKETLILGLSGGEDSVFLFQMLLLNKTRFICAHLNHKLRDQESEDDQVFCSKLCKAHNIAIEIKSKNIKKIAQDQKKGIEESARIERYKFFNQLIKKHKAKYILTAHHADDNAETIIKNLARGSSLSGLSGMPTISQNIFRPLLNISKSEIIDYLKTKKIPFVYDSSNSDTKYQRNFIRHEILPLFLKLNPSFAKTLSKNSQILKEIDDYLEIQAQKFIKKHSIDENKIDAKAFRNLHPAIQKQVIRTICEKYDLESNHIEEIIKLISNNVGNKIKTIKNIKFKINSNIIQLEKIHL